MRSATSLLICPARPSSHTSRREIEVAYTPLSETTPTHTIRGSSSACARSLVSSGRNVVTICEIFSRCSSRLKDGETTSIGFEDKHHSFSVGGSWAGLALFIMISRARASVRGVVAEPLDVNRGVHGVLFPQPCQRERSREHVPDVAEPLSHARHQDAPPCAS